MEQAMGMVVSWEDIKAKALVKADTSKDRFAGLWNSEDVQRLLTHTLYRWVFCSDGMGSGCLMFHRPTDAPHVLHQVVIGTGYADGVYELSIRKRHRVQTWMSGNTLNVQSTGTFDIVEIPTEDGHIGFSAMEMGEEAFYSALVKEGYLTEQQLIEAKHILAAGSNILPGINFVEGTSTASRIA